VQAALGLLEGAVGVIKIQLQKIFFSCIIIVASLFFLVHRVVSEDYAVMQGYVHNLNSNVAIYTGVFALNRDIDLDTTLYLKYTVDRIVPEEGTDANGEDDDDDDDDDEDEDDDHDSRRKQRDAFLVDIRSAASASGSTFSQEDSDQIKDTRNELTFGLTQKMGITSTCELYYDYSHEKDYISHTPSLTLTQELNQRNTALTFGYARNIDRIEGFYMDESEPLNTDNYYFGITQLLSPVMLTRIGYVRIHSEGQFSDGNSLIPLDGTEEVCTEISESCVEEVLPDSRSRGAFVIGLDRYFTGDFISFLNRSSVKLTFRSYQDDWGIHSYTEEVELNKYVTPQTIIRLNYRFYNQTSADFLKDEYTSDDQFKSLSPQYASFRSDLVGLKITYTFTHIPQRTLFSFMNGHSLEGLYESYRTSNDVKSYTLMMGMKFHL